MTGTIPSVSPPGEGHADEREERANQTDHPEYSPTIGVSGFGLKQGVDTHPDPNSERPNRHQKHIGEGDAAEERRVINSPYA
jgi:hypothetical protein